jgi:hypothetical protein
MDIEARGYANKIKVKTSAKGKPFTRFSLGVKQKEKAWGDRPEVITWAHFDVTDFSGQDIPEKSYVTVKGRLKVRNYTKDDVERQALEILADSVEVAEPLPGAAGPGPKAATPDKDPWE